MTSEKCQHITRVSIAHAHRYAESTNATVFLQPWDHSSRYVVCWCIQKTGTDHKISVNVSTRYRVRIATRLTLVRQAEHLEYDFSNIDKKCLNVMSGHTHEALADH